MLGTVHIALALASLILGAMVFFLRKGGRRHRRLGRLYAGALLLVNLSALSVYEESAGFGPFHALALVSLATLSGGVVSAFLRWPKDGWLEAHGYFMSWSYVGLVAAGAAQIMTKIAGPGSLQVLVPTALVVLVGGLLIHRRIPRILSGLAGRQPGPDKSLRSAPSELASGCRR